MTSSTKGGSVRRGLIARLREQERRRLKSLAGKPLSPKAQLDLATLASLRILRKH
jgi:hypothetical protein